MKIQISYHSWSDNEVTGYDSDSSTATYELKLGVVEECPLFYVAEIRDHSIMVAKKDGTHASLGTYSAWPSDLHEKQYGHPTEIFVGGKGVEVSSSYSYNGNSRGSSQTLCLIED